jgi:hypothetical protein
MRLLSAIPDAKQQLNRSGLNSSALLSAAKASVTEMSQKDLNELRSVYAKFPGWREMPQALLRPGIRQELQAKLDAKKAGEIISKVADDCAAGINAGTTNTDISIARAAEIAAEAVIEGMPTDGITIAARLIPVGLHAGARTAVLTLETLKGIKDDCRDDSFQDAITADVDAIPGLISNSTATTATNISASTASTATNINASTATTATNINASTATTATNITNAKTEILTAVEAAKTYIVTDANANKEEMKNLLLRTQIEADLASTDGSTFVALYQTPNSVCLTSLNELPFNNADFSIWFARLSKTRLPMSAPEQTPNRSSQRQRRRKLPVNIKRLMLRIDRLIKQPRNKRP